MEELGGNGSAFPMIVAGNEIKNDLPSDQSARSGDGKEEQAPRTSTELDPVISPRSEYVFVTMPCN